MELIQWTEQYSVGHPLIDSQHKKLVSLINELHNAMRTGRGKSVLQKILDDLVFYTKVHFSTEENMMMKANYPGFTEHKEEHDKLTATAVSFQTAFKNGSAVLTIQVMDFLKSWLIDHILGTDKNYKNKI